MEIERSLGAAVMRAIGAVGPVAGLAAIVMLVPVVVGVVIGTERARPAGPDV